MANENETIADIIAEMRNYIAECNRGLTAHTRYGNGAFPLDDLVKRIEAAHERECIELTKYSPRDIFKRETVDIESRAIYGEVRESGAKPLQDSCKQTLQGNVARMREALLAIRDLAKKTKSRSENINVALTTIFWYANGALIEIEKGDNK